MKGKLLRWGILSAGRISNDFVICLNGLPSSEHQVCAVAARSGDRAEEFAKLHSIPKHFDSYEKISDDPDIDIVYVGSIHTEHYKSTKMMLLAGKHVLCEKPICVTVAETKSLFDIAKSKNRFLMEGIWSRFFPAYDKLHELMKSGVIGDIIDVQAQFGEFTKKLGPRMCTKATAGGTLLDRGVYAVQFAQLVFNEAPIDLHAFGTLYETGIDTSCHIFLKYSNNRSAVISTSVLCNLPNEATISGTEGTIKVCFPLWCPKKIEVCVKYGEPQVYEYELPTISSEQKFNFRNSQGFQYEAEAVRKCIVGGLIECPRMTSQMSIHIAEIMEKSRHQIGYDLPQDGKNPNDY